MAQKITRSVTLFPNAKINLGLHITGKLPNGYHSLETLYYPVFNFKDVLKIEVLAEGSQGVELLTEAKIPKEENLVYKAVKHLENVVGELPPLRISLTKNIPAGAGLGGGSSDAAFTLKGLNELLNLRLSTETLHSLAEKLGADVPFFLYNKPMYATGTGTTLEQINFSLPGHLKIMAYPQIYSSTPEAYAGIKEIIPRNYTLKEALQKTLKEWKNFVFNDLEKPVFSRLPELKKIKESFYDSGATFALMSGSGSAVFGIYE